MSLARSAVGSWPVRSVTLGVLFVVRRTERLVSFCRARALFPRSPDVVCHWTSEVKYPENIMLGQQVVIGSHCTLGAAAPIRLEDNVRLSKGVTIETAGLDFSNGVKPPIRTFRVRWSSRRMCGLVRDR